MVQVGDIVKVRNHEGRWVVMAPAENDLPPGRRWRLRRDTGGHPLSHTAGGGDITAVLEHPTFEPGQTVTYHFSWDKKAEVVADSGDTIRLKYTRRRSRVADPATPIGVDGASFEEMVIDEHRGQLVAMNT